MTSADPLVVLAAYPQCIHAVSFVEAIMDRRPSPAEETAIETIRRQHPPIDIYDVIDFIRDSIQETIDIGSVGRYEEALAEVELPEFRVYMMGKMGYT